MPTGPVHHEEWDVPPLLPQEEPAPELPPPKPEPAPARTEDARESSVLRIDMSAFDSAEPDAELEAPPEPLAAPEAMETSFTLDVEDYTSGSTEPREGVDGDDELRSVIHHQADMLALADAGSGQPIGDPIDGVIEFGIGQLALAMAKRHSIWPRQSLTGKNEPRDERFQRRHFFPPVRHQIPRAAARGAEFTRMIC